MKKHPVIDETCAGCMYLGYLYPSSAAACRPNYCNYLDIVGHTRGCPAGKGGAPYGGRWGFCLETQFYPDSPNHDNFPSCVLRAGEAFHHTTVFRFPQK